MLVTIPHVGRGGAQALLQPAQLKLPPRLITSIPSTLLLRRDQVLGRNCRFLQGEGTDPEELQRLRDALSAEPPRAVTVRLLNFCYDGTPFWNSLHVAPVRNAAGQVRLGHCLPGVVIKPVLDRHWFLARAHLGLPEYVFRSRGGSVDLGL